MSLKNKTPKKSPRFPTRQAKIGIVGIGFVGAAVKHWFEKKKYPLFLYDKYKKIGSPQEINKADIVFICVPTPSFRKKEGFDDSAISESLKNLSGEKIVVIKSTILPGSTEKFQKKFPQHKILFNPEFLRERTACEDFIHPDRQILGVTQKSKSAAKKIMNLLPKAPYQKVIEVKEAEMVKYMANSFLAMKVVFANEFYDLCQKVGIDYNGVKEGTGKDHRIGESHLDVFQDGYRGYGGSCFPKDINTIIKFASDNKINMPLLKKIREINRWLLKKSGLSEDYFLKFLHRKKHDKKR